MSDDKAAPPVDKLRSILIRQGAALEMRVAQEFVRHGFTVSEGARYNDPIEPETVREADVIVSRAIAGADEPTFAAVIECKHSPRASWIGLQRTEHRLRPTWDAGAWFAGTPDRYAREQGEAAIAIALGEGFLKPDQPATRITTVFWDNEKNTANPAAGATQQALSGCLGYLPTTSLFETVAPEAFGLAVVVTTASLFTAQLNNVGDLMVTAVESFEVLTPNAGRELHPVLVMNDSALRNFVNAFNPTSQR